MSEKREFFRIKDRLEIEFREINKQEFLQLEREIRYRPSQLYADSARTIQYEEGRKWEDDKDMQTAYLKLLDRKVSAILDLLSRYSRDHDASQAKLFTAWYGEADISGAGLAFVLQTPFKEGALMHMKVMLPIFPYPTIHALCEAVRQREVPNEDSTGWKNAFKFLIINDLDRDLLISYIFDKEREQIRLHKALEDG
jgi:hypothetical protein